MDKRISDRGALQKIGQVREESGCTAPLMLLNNGVGVGGWQEE